MRRTLGVAVCVVIAALAMTIDARAGASGEPPTWSGAAALELTEFPGAVLVGWPQADDDGGLLGYEVLVDGEVVRQADASASRALLFGVAISARIEVVAIDGAQNRSVPLGVESAGGRVQVRVDERIAVVEAGVAPRDVETIENTIDSDADGIADDIDVTLIGSYRLDDTRWPSRRFAASDESTPLTAGWIRRGDVTIVGEGDTVLIAASSAAEVALCPDGRWHLVTASLTVESALTVSCGSVLTVVTGQVDVSHRDGTSVSIGAGETIALDRGLTPGPRVPVVAVRAPVAGADMAP